MRELGYHAHRVRHLRLSRTKFAIHFPEYGLFGTENDLRDAYLLKLIETLYHLLEGS